VTGEVSPFNGTLNVSIESGRQAIRDLNLLQGVALPTELQHLKALAGFEPATHEVTRIYGTTLIYNNERATGSRSAFLTCCHLHHFRSRERSEKQESNLQHPNPNRSNSDLRHRSNFLKKQEGERQHMLTLQAACRARTCSSQRTTPRSITHLRHLLFLFYNSIISIAAIAVPPFSIASSTSNTLSLQPAIKNTSSCTRLSGEVP
jgi:hypothetical protein